MTINPTNTELEVKFYVRDLGAVQALLEAMGAPLLTARTYEDNLRFDTPGRDLAAVGRVLRLRSDTETRLTYKGPSQSAGGARLRTEIEFTASDHQKARDFLEALGYQVIMRYEKYRTTYEIEGLHVLLDELPYGDFIEIEGDDPASIYVISSKLGLDWARRVPFSYTGLFDAGRVALELPVEHLVFDAHPRMKEIPAVVGLLAADVG